MSKGVNVGKSGGLLTPCCAVFELVIISFISCAQTSCNATMSATQFVYLCGFAFHCSPSEFQQTESLPWYEVSHIIAFYILKVVAINLISVRIDYPQKKCRYYYWHSHAWTTTKKILLKIMGARLLLLFCAMIQSIGDVQLLVDMNIHVKNNHQFVILQYDQSYDKRCKTIELSVQSLNEGPNKVCGGSVVSL